MIVCIGFIVSGDRVLLECNNIWLMKGAPSSSLRLIPQVPPLPPLPPEPPPGPCGVLLPAPPLGL